MKYFSIFFSQDDYLSGSVDPRLRGDDENLRISLRFIIIFISMVSAFLPALVFAAATLSISSSLPGLQANVTNPGSWIQSFYNLALMFGGVLAFGAVVYGGVLYAASAGNSSKQSEGKEWIWAALTGLLLLAGAYLILNLINPSLTNVSFPTLSSLQSGVATGGGTSAGGSGNPGVPASAGSTNPGTSAAPGKISTAATSYEGTNTSGGPGSGTVACAWAVNNVLTNAGVAALDSDSVQGMETALTSGRGTLVDPSVAVAGDIVIEGNDGHVGICLNTGCTQVISNSSSKGTFTWVSNNSFSSGMPSRIYQVNP